jgi:hypothetical protein
VTAYLDSGRLLAVLSADLSWGLWDVATGNRLSHHKPFDPTKYITTRNSSAWMADSFSAVQKEFGPALSTSDFDARNSKTAEVRSSDGLQMFTYFPHVTSDPDDYSEIMNWAGVHVADAASGKRLFDIPEALIGFGPPAVAPQGKVIVGPEKGNTVGIWDRNTGKNWARSMLSRKGNGSSPRLQATSTVPPGAGRRSPGACPTALPPCRARPSSTSSSAPACWPNCSRAALRSLRATSRRSIAARPSFR